MTAKLLHQNFSWLPECLPYILSCPATTCRYPPRTNSSQTSPSSPPRPLSLEEAHCFGHNRHSIGICYEGGLDGEGLPQDTRTPAQKAALTQLLQELGRQFPAALTVGHCDLNPQKACPSFDAVKEYKGHLSAVTLRSGVGLFL